MDEGTAPGRVGFSYPCQECGNGTVQETIFPTYEVQAGTRTFTVENAKVGICDSCGAKHFSAGEWKRWRREGNPKLENSKSPAVRNGKGEP